MVWTWPNPPRQSTWQRADDGPLPKPGGRFWTNHINTIAACDFFVVPIATFRLLWCFLILSHDRRRIVHFNVTDDQSARSGPSTR